MNAIEEYNNADVFYHAVSEWSFEQLLKAAGGKVENIVLYGRVFNPEVSFKEAEADGDYEEVLGKGYVYACDLRHIEDATPGASSMAGITLALGYDGVGEDEPTKKTGEWLVPLSSYKVIGMVDAE